MLAADPTDTGALIRVVAARRSQLWFRLALAGIIALIFHRITGWPIATGWILIYAAQQVAEHRWSKPISAAQTLSRHQTRLVLGSMVASNAIFGAFGVAQAFTGGPWGFVCGCLMWSGAMLNAAMSSVGSRPALLAWTVAPAVYFLTAPLLAVRFGAGLEDGLIVLVAGVLNALGSVAIWANARHRLEAEERERSATHAALHDPESGLPNRLALENEIAHHPAASAQVIVAAAGIDRFPELRAAIGYALAGRLIEEVAIRLRQVHEGTVARLSTSALGVCFDADDLPGARGMARRLQAVMATPLQLDGSTIDVSLTVGLAAVPAGDCKAQLLEQASIALDTAQKTKGSIVVFNPDQYRNPASNLSLMSDMLKSMARGEITNHYQPKYDLRSGRLIGVEALVRWNHPERGMVPPDAFIPMAEETGRIRELTVHVLRRAIRDQARLADRGHLLSFAVNLSGRLLHDDELAGTILDIVGPAASRVSLEVTETSMMENPEKALAILHRLRDAGIELSIDDYGSGLSSLAYLKNIPAHELKIDKAFVMRLDENQRDLLLVRSTVALAHSLGLRVAAEGVESATTLALLRAMNCNLAQGYHMARPMPFDMLLDLIDSGASIFANANERGAEHPRAVAAPLPAE